LGHFIKYKFGDEFIEVWRDIIVKEDFKFIEVKECVHLITALQIL